MRENGSNWFNAGQTRFFWTFLVIVVAKIGNFAQSLQHTMTDSKDYLGFLITDIENRLGRGMLSPKDFDYLRNVIETQLNEYVSTSTLKRIWGYTKYSSSPSASILSTLCRLVGYRDWEYYKSNRFDTAKEPSGDVLSDRIDVANDLVPGDGLRLTWSPQRVCDVVYHGDNEFEVVDSQNTGIKAGNWFNCSIIVAGEPLWLSNLRQPGKPPVAYVCGKLGGVSFSRIVAENKKQQEP